MSITKPFTFVPGTKARANEVNENFDVLYNQVNEEISDIEKINVDIKTLQTGKAPADGDASKIFNVADAETGTNAMNKQSVKKFTDNVNKLITGLEIVEDTGAQSHDAIIVKPGSAHDNTGEKTLTLNVATTYTIPNISDGAKYLVYIVGNDSASVTRIDVSIIDVDKYEPPTGYPLFRKIGVLHTGSDRTLSSIDYFGITPNKSIYDTKKANMVPLIDWERMASIGGTTATALKTEINKAATGVQAYSGNNRTLHYGDIYLKDDFTNFPRIMIVSTDNGGNYRESTVYDTWELDWLLSQGPSSSSGKTNLIKLEGRRWDVYSYNYVNGAFKSNTKFFYTNNNSQQNCGIIEIYGLNN